MPEGNPRPSCLPVLAESGLHEFFAEHEADSAAPGALALMLAAGSRDGAWLWVRHEPQGRETGLPYPSGLAELGLSPAAVLFFRAQDVASALQAGLEGARCAALGAVIIELRGEAKAYDLVASRRLSLAGRTCGVPVVMVRLGASPVPSAAHTRWQVRALPSRPLAAKAPGPPGFELSLLRARNGREGVLIHVEWDRDARQFIPRSPLGTDLPARRAAPVSGAVVPVPLHRPGAPDVWRHAG